MNQVIKFNKTYKLKLLGYIIIFLAIPLITVPLINSTSYENPNLLKYTIIFGGIGSALMFVYIFLKVYRIQAPIQITTDVVTINWPKKTEIQIQNIRVAEVDTKENVIINLYHEIENSKEKQFTVYTEALDVTPLKLCKYINQAALT